jgi:type II secretory ATPase GspE/PulE/Tfp pilus assembly ATPase PilB-like protein
LSLVLSQRLLRRLCDRCKKPAELSPTVAQGLRQKGVDPKKLFEAGGCEACGGTGYYGRTAVCDLLVVTDNLRTAIAQDGTIATKLKTDGDRQGRSNLRTEALRKAVAGITSLEEIKRVAG